MDLGLEGRRALITGAKGGIGFATAKLLADEGVELTLTDLDVGPVRDFAEASGARAVEADLGTREGVEGLFRAVGTDFDILIHTTGVTGSKGDPLTMSEADWDDAWRIDFLSAVRLARELGPAMIGRQWGRMVFITSENVAQPYADETVYNAAKSALLSFSKSVAIAHAAEGLLVNCVAPAFIATPMTDQMMAQRAEKQDVGKEEAIQSFIAEERPFLKLGRRGRPEEVAPVIALLCSERASFVSGANWRVDGGSVGSIDV